MREYKGIERKQEPHPIYSQTWTCADGSFIKVTIPDGATREDVLCMMDMLAVIAERRYPDE